MSSPSGLKQYRAKPRSCSPCALEPRRTGVLVRLTRNVHENEREHGRRLAGTAAFMRSACERRKVEMLFAHLKRNLGFGHLRGPPGANDKFLLAATAQNRRRLARSLVTTPPTSVPAPA